MANELNQNKISEKEKRRASRIREQLRHQGVGEDEATKRALKQAQDELHSGKGGGRNSGGEAQKGADKRRGDRLR